MLLIIPDSDLSSVPYFLIVYASQNPYSEDILLYYYILMWYVPNIALLKFLFCLPLKFARLADFFHSTQTNIKVGSRKSIGKDPKLVCCATQNFSRGHPRAMSTTKKFIKISLLSSKVINCLCFTCFLLNTFILNPK